MAHQFFFNPFILDNLPAPATGFDVVQDLSEPRLRMVRCCPGFVRTTVANVYHQSGNKNVHAQNRSKMVLITYILKTPVRNICGDNSHA